MKIRDLLVTGRFLPGTRVRTPLGEGAVKYVRMAPPDYRSIDAISVLLDSRKADPRYSGTIFNAADVTSLLDEA